MTVTSRLPKSRALLTSILLVFLFGAQFGCSRPLTVPAESRVGQADPPQDALPVAPKADGTPLGAINTGAAEDNLPFRDRDTLPAGTMISVLLKSPILVGSPETGNTFEAVVAEPVVIEGNTLIPSGADAGGVVESARTSAVKANRGYIRLSLASVHVNGIDVPVQTASLFARQSTSTAASTSVISVEKGRRLTFRLTQQVYLVKQHARARY